MGGKFILLAAVTVALVLAQNCDPRYDCEFTTVDGKGITWFFDLSSLCSSTDYLLQDTQQHIYNVNVCGYANGNCLPATWDETFEYGVAIQAWGALPDCTQVQCQHKSGGEACCTKDCEVIGVGEPTWGVMNATNVATGGIIAHFKGAAPAETDPYWCDFNPETGTQFERQVTYFFHCDPLQHAPLPLYAEQNITNDCHYGVHFLTDKACGTVYNGGGGGGGLSGGWVFIIILISVTAAAFVGGAVLQYQKTHTWGIPFTTEMASFVDLVKDGIAFTMNCFQPIDRRATPGAPGAFAEDTSKGGAAYQTATPYERVGDAPAAAAPAKKPEAAYTDL